MTDTASETISPVDESPNVTDTTRSSGERPATQYMQGWALASLTLAFMSICFVLAIDNTVLGSYS